MQNKQYEFGSFRLDVAERLLQCEGKPVPLTPKALDVLIVLAANPGRLITKTELVEKVWPDTFVEEATLAQNIATIRRALAKHAGERRFIETVPKAGYRFFAAAEPDALSLSMVEESTRSEIILEEEDIGEGPVTAPPPARTGMSRIGGAFAVVAVAAAAAVAAYLWAAGREPATAPPIRSLLVLPFVNIGDAADEYFADGITEEAIHAFTNVKGLRVVARSTAFQFKGKPQDIRELGKRLDVDTVLEGSVRRQQNQLRVTAQLNRVADGANVWSRSWDRDTKDIFAIEREIAQSIIAGFDSGNVTLKSATNDLTAYNAFLLGRYHRTKLGGDSIPKAVQYFLQAIEKDPSYADAYAALADCYQVMGYNSQIPPKEAYEKVRGALRQALALNPSLAYPHTVQAKVALYYERDWAASDREIQTAMSLDPTDPELHHFYSHYLLAMGKVEESLRESQRAIECDPLNSDVLAHLAFHYVYARNYEAAVAAAARSFDVDPNHWSTRIFLTWAYQLSGQFDKAIEIRSKMELAPGAAAELRKAVAESGGQGYWRSLLSARLEDPKAARLDVFGMVLLYAAVGDRDRAFDSLQQAFEDRNSWLVYLKIDPRLDGLRGDPRFDAWIKRVGLP